MYSPALPDYATITGRCGEAVCGAFWLYSGPKCGEAAMAHDLAESELDITEFDVEEWGRQWRR